MEKQEIINLIRKNFKEEGSPLKEEIVNDISGEGLEITNAFFKRKWTEIEKNTLKFHNSALAYFSNKAFTYYLPAYMILLVEDIKYADVIGDYVVRHLTLPIEIDSIRLIRSINQSGYMTEDIDEFLRTELKESTKRVNQFIKKVSGFSSDQGACINRFLQYLYSNYPNYYPDKEPLIAVERYWFQFS